jgi:predicted ATPase
MGIYIKRISATGVYNRFDIEQNFKNGVNIIFGKNGAGKTTLLHIIANALNSDFKRFFSIPFETIVVELSNQRTFTINQKKKDGLVEIVAREGGKVIYKSREASDGSRFVVREESGERVVYRIRDNILERIDKLENYPLDISKEIIASNIVSEEGVIRKIARGDIPNAEPILSAAYFPAFRTMIEAWAASEKNEEDRRVLSHEDWQLHATKRARGWFGDFVPMISFPSLISIEEQLSREVERARMEIWTSDRRLLSQAFLDIFMVLPEKTQLVEKPEVVLRDIQGLFTELEKSPLKAESSLEEVYNKLRGMVTSFRVDEEAESSAIRVLNVYRKTLQETLDMQKKSFSAINKYLSSVNEFFDEKELSYNPSVTRNRLKTIGIRYKKDGSYTHGLRTLSSGERQIVTLIYASTHMSKQQVVLIDEPEISLHIDWQRLLINKMADQLGDRQIIACTHSPIIGADYENEDQELNLKPTKIDKTNFQQSETTEEEIPF